MAPKGLAFFLLFFFFFLPIGKLFTTSGGGSTGASFQSLPAEYGSIFQIRAPWSTKRDGLFQKYSLVKVEKK